MLRKSQSRGSEKHGQQDAGVNWRSLAQVPLFLDLSKRELQRLSSVTHERDFASGDVLMEQGEAGHEFFILLDGRARVTQKRDGTAQELAMLKAGDVAGEMALLDDAPRSATVTAVEPIRALVLPVADFRTALREDPDITIKLLSVLSRRLRRAELKQL